MSIGGTVEEPSQLDTLSAGSNAAIDQTASPDTIARLPRVMLGPEALLYTHPDYDDYQQKWKKYIDCYRATNIYRFIHKHTRESDDVFKMRVKRGYFFNYVASIVDLFVAYLFEAGVTRRPDKALSDELDAIYKDADRAGSSYEVFMQTAATFAIATGHVGILVDMPRTDGQIIQTEQHRKEVGLRPHLTLMQANQIRDWEVDDFGRFEWVKLEIFPPQERTWNESVDQTTRTFLIWTKTNWELWEYRVRQEDSGGDGQNKIAEAVQIDSGAHPLGEVPLVILKNDRNLEHSWFGESAVRDITDINLAILNWCSFADEEVANRCLNLLAMQIDENDKPINISHYNVLEYPPEASPPQYLTPGETPLRLIWEAIDQARNEIYRLAKLSGSTGLLGVREATSGIAYAFEFNETNQSLSQKAEFLEQAEREIHRLLAKWLGTDFDGEIVYPQEFGVDDFLLELQILTEARTAFSSETAIRELEKRVATKMFARSKQDLRRKIEEEIQRGDAKMDEHMMSFSRRGRVPGQSAGPSQQSTDAQAPQKPAPTTG